MCTQAASLMQALTSSGIGIAMLVALIIAFATSAFVAMVVVIERGNWCFGSSLTLEDQHDAHQ